MAISKKFYLNLSIILAIIVAIIVIIYLYFPKVFGDSLYPLKYEDLIIKYSREYNVDPSLVSAIIYSESRFDKDASSRAGAQGLMQIMPATGKGISERIGDSSFGDLYDPETSIRYGTYYIKSLLDKYNGDVESALAAYNGGAVAGDRFVITRSFDDIPDETAGYLKKVTSTQKMYDYLYSNIFSAKDIKELITIKKEEEEKPWYKKILEKFGWSN